MPPVGEMASENLSGENRRAGWGDAAQLNEHVAFAFDGWVLRVRSVSFGFRRAQLCFDEIETGMLTLELGAKTSRKRQSFAGTQCEKINARSS